MEVTRPHGTGGSARSNRREVSEVHGLTPACSVRPCLGRRVQVFQTRPVIHRLNLTQPQHAQPRNSRTHSSSQQQRNT